MGLWPYLDSDCILTLVSQLPLQLLGDVALSDTCGPSQTLNPKLNQDLNTCIWVYSFLGYCKNTNRPYLSLGLVWPLHLQLLELLRNGFK